MFLRESQNEAFINDLILQVYAKDKNASYLQEKMCAHGPDIVEKWKTYDKERPQTTTGSQWRSILQRGIIYVFTLSDPIHVIDKHIHTPSVLTFRTGGGDSSRVMFLDVDYNMGVPIGEKYTDEVLSAPTGRKKAGGSYAQEEMKHIRVIYDITLLVREIQLTGILPSMLPEALRITSICPQG
ncbi:MAG: hypothetical protein K2X53_01840 [Alphaproteobacteria bacterium]|nr:hypothetical protein [Alphaproteobacteria bacterium]